jgi:hypothetical protein
MNKNIEIIEYKPEHKKLWEEFIDNSNNGNYFSLSEILDYHTRVNLILRIICF